LPLASQSGSIEASYRDRRLRLTTLSHAVIGAGTDSPIRVTVGVTLAGHDAMVQRLWFSAFAQQLALVAIAGLFVLLGLRRGLAPLMRLRDTVRSPDRSDLDPVEVPGAQSEIRPLIDALNAYMERVRAQMAAQRRFIANAAHQLRTPLALMSTQASYVLRESAADRREEALVALQAGSG
ncbi:MAG: HAMP domain-containing protein, partial [Mesorhizobium sp.]